MIESPPTQWMRGRVPRVNVLVPVVYGRAQRVQLVFR
jgi:hypothetical protein